MTAADGAPDAAVPGPAGAAAGAAAGASSPVVPEVVGTPRPPGVLDLVVRGTRLGIDAAGLLVAEVAGAGVRVARAVLPPVVAAGPLDAVDDVLVRGRDAVREREVAHRDDVVAAVQGVIGRVVDLVVEQIDFGAVIDKVPVDEIVDRVDVNAIVARLDVGAITEEALDAVDITAIVRESTTGLAGETIDVIRTQAMVGGRLSGRLVDRVLRRPPREVSFPAYDAARPEVAAARERS